MLKLHSNVHQRYDQQALISLAQPAPQTISYASQAHTNQITIILQKDSPNNLMDLVWPSACSPVECYYLPRATFAFCRDY